MNIKRSLKLTAELTQNKKLLKIHNNQTHEQQNLKNGRNERPRRLAGTNPQHPISHLVDELRRNARLTATSLAVNNAATAL
jgi:hypothetical protein